MKFICTMLLSTFLASSALSRHEGGQGEHHKGNPAAWMHRKIEKEIERLKKNIKSHEHWLKKNPGVGQQLQSILATEQQLLAEKEALATHLESMKPAEHQATEGHDATHMDSH